MSTIEIEKSYIPQYIQFHQLGDKLEGSLDDHRHSHRSAHPEIIVYPTLPKSDYTTGPQNLYPSLIPPNTKTCDIKTPLIPKSKKHAPTKANWYGIFLAFMSGVFFTLCSGTVKYLTDIDPMELLIFRSLCQVALTLPIALSKGHNILGPQGSRLLLLAQGIVGGTTLVLLFYSFRLLPLGDAATIIFSSPVFVMVMSHIWLREPCGFYRTFIVTLLVTGVVMITKPPFLFPNTSGVEESYNVLGYVAALCGTVFTAINIVVMRKCKDVHYSVVVFQFSFWSLVISSGILALFGELEMPDNTVREWILCVLVAVFGVSGQILVAVALGHEGAGRVAVTRSLDIVLAYILQVTIFGEVPNWQSVLGAGMVIICVIGMGLESVIHHLFSSVP